MQTSACQPLPAQSAINLLAARTCLRNQPVMTQKVNHALYQRLLCAADTLVWNDVMHFSTAACDNHVLLSNCTQIAMKYGSDYMPACAAGQSRTAGDFVLAAIRSCTGRRRARAFECVEWGCYQSKGFEALGLCFRLECFPPQWSGAPAAHGLHAPAAQACQVRLISPMIQGCKVDLALVPAEWSAARLLRYWTCCECCIMRLAGHLAAALSDTNKPVLLWVCF